MRGKDNPNPICGYQTKSSQLTTQNWKLRTHMCITSRLQQHIRNLTGDGEVVARFLVDTVEGRHTGAKYHHKLEAMKHIVRFGFTEDDGPHFWGLIPTPEELAASPSRHSRENGNPAGQGGDTDNSRLKTVNSLDILNYDIAHLIRQETADGHTIAEFLTHVMTRRDRPFTPKKLRIRHTDRMAAAREILRRGFGHFGRKRKLVIDEEDTTNEYDTLHTDLAKRMREYSEHGTDAVRFLLDVMEDANPDEPYTWGHRMSAAQELLRRGWDTNYDAITPEMLQDYWRDQQSTRLSVGQKKHLAGLPVSLDDYDQYDNEDYQAKADTIREQEDIEALSHVEKNPLSPRERARVRGSEEHQLSQSTPTHDEFSHNEDDFDDDKPDCYHEPLAPDLQVIFDHQMLVESGEYEEDEITIHQPTPEDWKAHESALASLRELAAAEGVPLRPNPLADKLKASTIRGP